MMGCKNCQGVSGASMLIAGILFLLQDLKIWDFWKINWYTVLFILLGIGALGMRLCPNCQEIITGKMKK